MKMLNAIAVAAALLFACGAQAQSGDLKNLYKLTDSKTRSISPENFTGEKGKGGMATEGTGAKAARDLGQGACAHRKRAEFPRRARDGARDRLGGDGRVGQRRTSRGACARG